MVALLVDWLASTLVVVVLIGPQGWSDDRLSGFYTMAVYVVEATVLSAWVGGSFGKLVTRLRLVRYDGSGAPVTLLGALVRHVLVCLVIPPLVFRPDGRGLHDLAAGTATVTLQTASGAAR